MGCCLHAAGGVTHQQWTRHIRSAEAPLGRCTLVCPAPLRGSCYVLASHPHSGCGPPHALSPLWGGKSGFFFFFFTRSQRFLRFSQTHRDTLRNTSTLHGKHYAETTFSIYIRKTQIHISIFSIYTSPQCDYKACW